ncbi:ATP-binding cassette domain-containing protein [Streptomyces luteolifulvus]|jgi:ABC-2 type transport system ATP-binding protein|uniref:ABC-type xenobiotic transporter n=1 Tax=Streptomyces luteolifulvus TaxID=2615112 RepID=A0A6H9UZF8_9ACTN|nr:MULTISPECIES: ATP-binding cassette domain-containing protein [Streptomyces]KAB1145071.1 ATP-binding cassette domain-containing protein [Streptomyces luteolifulvus]MXM68964.1 ATP-binding cassette domain-containing protein [Streptomyces sp. HUCO-GS316]
MIHEMAVEASGLRKSYGKVQVLQGVDIGVRKGSVFALLGPNGSGKTTTVRILSTLTSLDGGEAKVAGFDVTRERRKVRQRITLTGQQAAIDKNQTGAENLYMMARLSGLSRAGAHERARYLLERFDLTEAGGRRLGTYSGGMARRLDLAASLVSSPSVVFLDEPTTGLDPRSRQALWGVVADLAASGLTVFLTTQYLEEADRLADRVALLDGGKVVAEGTPDELKERVSGQRLDLELADRDAFETVLGLLGDRIAEQDRDLLTIGVATDGSAHRVRSLLDEVDPDRDRVAKFSIHSATLDDVFLALTGRTVPDAEAGEVKETAGV